MKEEKEKRCDVAEFPTRHSSPDHQKKHDISERPKWKFNFSTPSIKKELIPLKIVLFCWSGAVQSLIPYLTIYWKYLGVTASEIAFMYTFFPFIKLLGPFIAGIVADKLGRYKPILYVAFVCNIIFATSLLFIPIISQSKCHSSGHLTYCDNRQKPELFVEGESCFFENRTFEIKVEYCNLECQQSSETKILDTLCFDGNENPYCINVRRDDGEHLPLKLNVSMSSGLENVSCYFNIESISDNNQTVPLSTCSIQNITENCGPFCRVQLFDVDPQRCELKWFERLPTLAMTFTLCMGMQMFVSICYGMIDTTALTMVKEHDDDFGRQQILKNVAIGIFPPLTGFLIDVVSAYNERTDYSPAIYIFNILNGFNILLLYILDFSVVPPAGNIMKNIKGMIVIPEVLIFLVAMFFLGTFWGFLESFLFWYLVDLGSPKYLLGLTVSVGAIVSLPFFYTWKFLVKKFNTVNILITAFMFYAIRYIGYSYIYNPWWSMLFESMEAFTNHLMWLAAVTYAASLAPDGLLATIQGSVAGMHFGIGRGSGSLIGGNLMSMFNSRIVFRLMGVASAILGALYGIIFYGILRNLKRNNGGKKEKAESNGDLRNTDTLKRTSSTVEK